MPKDVPLRTSRAARRRLRWQQLTGDLWHGLRSFAASALLHMLLVLGLSLLTLGAAGGRGGVFFSSAPLAEGSGELPEGESLHLDVPQFAPGGTADFVVPVEQPAPNPTALVSATEPAGRTAGVQSSAPAAGMEVLSPHSPLQSSSLLSRVGPRESFSLSGNLPTGPEGDPLASSAGDAASVITSAIQHYLQTDSVLVVLVWDASISMKAARRDLADSMSDQHRRLIEPLIGKGRECHYALHSFGQGVASVGNRTRDPSLVAAAVARIREDDSGVENVMGAVKAVVAQHRRTWQGALIVVVMTDEAGDDMSDLESAIAVCHKHEAQVCVLGPKAMPGRREGFRLWNGDTYLPVTCGPDGGVLDRVQIPSWIGGAATESLAVDFGCYALSRLARQTGGKYVICDSTTRQSRFSPELMKHYAPDLRSREAILKEIAHYPLRNAVAKAAEVTAAAPPHVPGYVNVDVWPLLDRGFGLLQAPTMHFWHEPGEYQSLFLRALGQEQSRVERTQRVVLAALQILDQPEIAAEYDREMSRRWRVAYELELGQLLALSVRCEEYLRACKQVRSGKHLPAGATQVQYESVERYGSTHAQRTAERAKEMLERCVRNHRNTPWAFLAQAELGSPLGVAALGFVTKPNGTASGPATGPPVPRGPKL